MGQLIDGKWYAADVVAKENGGRYQRSDSQFRNWITRDGTQGPSGSDGFRAEADRYHLYVGHACPWAHRSLIFRSLKGLEDKISLSVVHWHMGQNGWSFEHGDGVIPDPNMNARYLHQIYTKADPHFSGRVTVPVLWDKHLNVIVSNESSEIIRMLNSSFESVGATPDDFYPEVLREEIDRVNERVYETVNNGVYRSGFARTQEAYEEAVVPLFESLDWLESLLADRIYVCGDHLTEADWRLFTTLIRFDAVYYFHFKCNLRRIRDYPHLQHFVERLCGMPGISDTVHMDHIKRHYFGSHLTINPTGIVPMGPDIYI